MEEAAAGDARSPLNDSLRDDPPSGPPRTRRRRTPLLIVAILLFLLALIVTLASMKSWVMDAAVELVDRPAGASTETVLFVVERGSSAGDIAQHLADTGLITNPSLFRLVAQYYGISELLEAGEYELSPSMTMTEIMGRINKGLVRATPVTIPEGWRVDEIAHALEQKGIFPADEFLRATTESYNFPFLPSGSTGTRLEGYLFPDTYRVHRGERPGDLVRRMLEDFDRRVTPLTEGKQWPGGLTLQQAVILASIVEREAALPEERPIIAGVFLNRLRIGMRLEADPTLQYAAAPPATDEQPTVFWKRLTETDKLTSSPYNTYRYAGLPPGPICNPGLASIQAVMDPATVSYLFFVARGDGSHAFANTFEEHLENVRRYQ